MSTRINVQFTHESKQIKGTKLSLPSIRLWVDVQFLEEEEKWSESISAMIDTGAPISLIPLDIWKKARIDILDDLYYNKWFGYQKRV